tara:strand:+ start:348 stop:1139 length:792 start_codon:yes stop_codon:yes gene_type:complete
MKNTLLAACSIALLLYSCKDQDVINNPELTSTQATQDHLFAEQTFNDVARIVEEGFLTPGIKGSFPSYNLIDNNTLIINFGTNCIYNQKLYSGKIIVTYSGNYRDSLSLITTNFDNYHVNNNLIQGERIVTNEGRNSNGNMWFTIAVNNGSITTPQNGTINWESNSTREWISGQNTNYNILDDTYKISGNASGNSANGNDFNALITNPLVIHLDCYSSCLAKSGTAKVSPNGYPDRIIDYGDSICDCNFDVTINGINYPILIN